MSVLDENRFFREVTLRICGSLEIERALEETFGYLQEFVPAQVAILLYYDPESAAAYVMACAGGDQRAVGFDPATPLFSMDGETLERLRLEGASVNRENVVRIFNRPRTDPIYRAIAHFLKPWGLADFSNMMMRLDIGANYQGVLAMVAPGFDAFEDGHAKLIQVVEEPFAIAMSNARRYWEAVHLKDQLAEDNKAMHREMAQISGNQVVGADFGLRRVMELVRQVAPMNAPVLLLGETGTGKEVIANAIHMASLRRDGPLVRVQCGAIPDALLDSELFGHEKGAFTGAVQAKRGRFERADGGTLFFDEIGELTLGAQVKLLRVLQDNKFERLGGSKTISVDVRIIAATNRDLQRAVQEGQFREDLWFRLNVFPIQLPPLRQRREDIPALVQWFVDRKSREMGLPEQPIPVAGAVERLLDYDWPGNVRELQNVIERALILGRGGSLEFPQLGPQWAGDLAPAEADMIDEFPTLDEVAAVHIRRALTATRGRVQGEKGAARLLGVNPSTLRARMRKLGISFGLEAF